MTAMMLYLFVVGLLNGFLSVRHVDAQDFPPIPLSHCDGVGAVRTSHSVREATICEGDRIEYPVAPGPSDVVTAELVVYNPSHRILGVVAEVNVLDFEFNVLAYADAATKGRRNLGRAVAYSQQNQCGVPMTVELDGIIGCSSYDLTVTLQERNNFNIVGTSFDNATPLAEGAVSNFCGSLKDLFETCETGPVWSFNAKKKDKLLINSLLQGPFFFVKALLYDEMESEVDSYVETGDGRVNLKMDFSIPKDGKYFLRLISESGSTLASYAIAIQLASSSSSTAEEEGACKDTSSKFYIKKGKCKSLKKLLKKKPGDARSLCEDEASGAASACPRTCSMCPPTNV